MMEIKTIRYLPKHIGNIEEFRQICTAYDEELKLLWGSLETQLRNLNLSEMDADTCDRWAKIFGITFMPDDTLEDKRRLIRGKMTSGLPYTERKIKEVVSTMIGDGYYIWMLDRQGKTLKIGVLLAECMNVDAVRDIIREMVPADMDVQVYIYFNRWERFKPTTWGELWNGGADTWNDVKANSKWQEG